MTLCQKKTPPNGRASIPKVAAMLGSQTGNNT